MYARDLDFDADYRCGYLPGVYRIVGVPREWQPQATFVGDYLVTDNTRGEWVENDASDTVIISPVGSEQQFTVKIDDLTLVDTGPVNL